MPDIHWHIGDDEEHETIRASSPRRSRRSWLAIAIVVILGVGLGMAYRSIPEPAPRPTPTPPPPTPTRPAVPATLYATVDREAQALADGDRATLDSIVDIPDFEQYRALTGNFTAWGRPADATLYFIEDYRPVADDKAWVEVRQFHTDRFVQEVRFYQLRNGAWRRVDFDPSFWSGQMETADTPHFRFTYFIEDQALIASLAAMLEADYEQICWDFACPVTAETCVAALGRQWCSSFPRTITTTLILSNQTDRRDGFDLADNGDLAFTTQSPRLLDQFMPSDREQYFRNPLAWLHVVRLAYGNRVSQELFENSPAGHALVIAIFFHESDRLWKRTGSSPLEIPDEFKQLDAENPPPLEAVWNADSNGMDAVQMYAIAYGVITYIDQEFGEQAVTRLLKAIGSSTSLAEAIESSTGQPFAEFEQAWRAWIKANFATLSTVPANLRDVIDREAQALADGDLRGYLALQTPASTSTISASTGSHCIQCNILPAWEHPAAGLPLYTIISTTLRTSTNAWVDVRQFRNGRWFRDTRFYQFNAEEDRWLRSDPDPLFWSGQTETLDTPHFHAIYFVEDRDLARPIVQALEEVYPQVCRDLGCTDAAAPLTFTLKLNRTSSNGLLLLEDARELTFPSPRLTGVYEDRPLDSSVLVWGITVATVQRAYYQAASQWNGDAEGHVVFNAIIDWAMQRMAGEPQRMGMFTADLKQQDLVPLSQLWGKAYVYDQNNQMQPRTDTNIIYPESGLVIRFIEQEYGAAAMPKLLAALATARSFENLIEKSLGIPFAEFDQKWQAWAKQNIAKP